MVQITATVTLYLENLDVGKIVRLSTDIQYFSRDNINEQSWYTRGCQIQNQRNNQVTFRNQLLTNQKYLISALLNAPVRQIISQLIRKCCINLVAVHSCTWKLP
jgi:hypothetical protein